MQQTELQSAPTSEIGQALGQAMMSEAQKSRTSMDSHQTGQTGAQVRNVWQHPFVDVFKHCKILPVQDWKLNKRHGDVTEITAKEIGRKAIQIKGTVPANNYIQIPHPQTLTKNLGLTGRFIYLQVKAPLQNTPFSFQIDLAMAERTHGVRISASNLYKKVTTQNGFVMQVPLNLDINRWTVIVFDIYELLKYSRLLPQNYIIEGSYQIKSFELCANSVVRGLYTSDNLYDFVTLPPEMRFKFSFNIQRWPEFFAWLELPQDLDDLKTEKRLAEERLQQTRAKAALKAQFENQHMTNDQLKQMQLEIDALLVHQRQEVSDQENNFLKVNKGQRYEQIQEEMKQMMANKSGYSGDDLMTPDEKMGFGYNKQDPWHKDGLIPKGIPMQSVQQTQYSGGQFIGQEIKRSTKLNVDPIMELKHIIGYSPESCLNLKWSRLSHENVVIFTSAGVLIAMDVETLQQKRFFFGHSAPISCFDIASHGALIASAQEGQNSMIRIWDYHTARCLSMLPMPVSTMKCLSFSADGQLLASVGKDDKNKEIIVVWDLSGIYRNEKPQILARQTSHFNILCLKFSPYDPYSLVSCGKENIRFWRIKDTGNIAGSSVVLNSHARGTVFTCLDFAQAPRAGQDPLKCVYVATKHGMVFQINHNNQNLESFQKINDSSIFSIACNESFCVTGSEDKYLRMWPLDISGQVLEVRHEGTVCALEISADGLRVCCGTLSGSLGVLDKSNQRYRTLIRSHTDKILSMDFHLALRNIITVSLDGTIRLWHLSNYEQVIEFNSLTEFEMPLCVAAHPTLSLFSCGFQNGAIRLFDIEQLRVVSDLFSSFTKPIKALTYSPTGDMLVTCCEDGSFAIHNARRQHMLTKVINLEFAPPMIHVAYSPLIERQKMTLYKSYPTSHINMDNQSSDMDMEVSEKEEHQLDDSMDVPEVHSYYESLFAVMGECGNNVMIYSSDSIVLRHQIHVGSVVKSFQFSKRGNEIIIVTKDQRIRFYSLSCFEGTFLKELSTVHRGAIRTTDLSNNGGFMLTGGDDNLIKLWDYDAQTSAPTHFQAFIGHTYPVVNTLFNPWDNNIIFSAGERDGIFIWQFHGDMQTNYFPQIEDDEQQQLMAMSMQVDRDALHRPTELEQMRATVQERRRPRLAEFSFMMPEFKKTKDINLLKLEAEHTSVYDIEYMQRCKAMGLTANHFVGMQDLFDQKVSLNDSLAVKFLGDEDCKVIEPTIVNGYDGFGGVHDNLIWIPSGGLIIYTLNNKVIFENTKTREQTVLAVSTVRLSCLAQSSLFNANKLIAAAEGETNHQGVSNIYLINVTTKKVVRTLVYHTAGVQTMAFGCKDRILVSVGVSQSHMLALHSVDMGHCLKTAQCPGVLTNKVVCFDDNPKEDEFIWVTLGNKGTLVKWGIKFDIYQNDIDSEINAGMPKTDWEWAEIPMPTEELMEVNFLSGAVREERMLIGCSDGTVCSYNFDPFSKGFFDEGRQVRLGRMGQQVTQVWFKEEKRKPGENIGTSMRKYTNVVVGYTDGNLYSYTINALSEKEKKNNLLSSANMLPPDDKEKITLTELKSGAITAIWTDEKNDTEGMVGTGNGSIFFVSFKENKENQKPTVKIVSKVGVALESVDILRIDPGNPKVFLANCGQGLGEVKLLSCLTLDTVFKFKDFSLGPVAFVTSARSAKNSPRLIGYQSGKLRFIHLNELTDQKCYQLKLEEGEDLTCGCYSANQQNWAVGTSFGSIFIGSPLKNIYRNQEGWNCVRIDRLIKENEQIAVTSLQMTMFNPNGQILAAFENGEVKLWKSHTPEDKVKKYREKMESEKSHSRKRGGSSRNRHLLDVAELGITKFDIYDTFDMFETFQESIEIVDDDDQHLQVQSEVSDPQLNQCQGKRHRQTQAFFDPTGSNANELYYSFVGALPCIFVRNFEIHQVMIKINLCSLPTVFQVLDCSGNRFAKNLTDPNVSLPFSETAVVVGTKESQVFVYNIEGGKYQCVGRTKPGIMFGEIRGLAVNDDGSTIITSSSTGEVASYRMLKPWEATQ